MVRHESACRRRFTVISRKTEVQALELSKTTLEKAYHEFPDVMKLAEETQKKRLKKLVDKRMALN